LVVELRLEMKSLVRMRARKKKGEGGPVCRVSWRRFEGWKEVGRGVGRGWRRVGREGLVRGRGERRGEEWEQREEGEGSEERRAREEGERREEGGGLTFYTSHRHRSKNWALVTPRVALPCGSTCYV
jgi:hypothetical protein